MQARGKIKVKEIKHGHKVSLDDTVYYLLKVTCENTKEKLLIVFIDGDHIRYWLSYENYDRLDFDFSIFSLEISRVINYCFSDSWLVDNISTVLSKKSKKIVEKYLQKHKNGVQL